MTQNEKSDNRVAYSDPANLTDAGAWRNQLVEEISVISTQLSDRNKQDRCTSCNGRGCVPCNDRGSIRWSNERFHTWRKSAITALRARENVLRKLNTWIDNHDKEDVRPDDLIAKAHALLRALEEDDVDFDEDEQAVIQSLGDYLEPKKKLSRTGS